MIYEFVLFIQRTPWVVRGAPPTIGISSRGGRGGSIDRGRGRGRGSYHSTLGYQRSTSMYDEDARGVGRVSALFYLSSRVT